MFSCYISFHASHCVEALAYADGNVGKALEILFYKYHNVEENVRSINLSALETSDYLQKISEEKEALQSIYDDCFNEKIKNQIWSIDLVLDYLVKNNEIKSKKNILQPLKKDICRLYLQGKCRFGIKCRFIHQQPKIDPKEISKEDPKVTLEIRFPEGKSFTIMIKFNNG